MQLLLTYPNRSITGIFFIAFVAAANAIVLNCNFRMVSWAFIGPVYTCTGTLIVTGSPVNIVNVTGHHLDDYSNADVSALTLFNQLIVFGIPNNVVDFFPNLTVISMTRCGLASFTKDDLLPFPNLQMLILFDNQLTELDSDLFSFTPTLQYINLGSNFIRHLGPNIFKPLYNLQTLRMEDNICINRSADNNRSEVDALVWQTTFRCPSSITQIESEIIGGSSFKRIIDALRVDVSALEQRVLELESSATKSTTEGSSSTEPVDPYKLAI